MLDEQTQLLIASSADKENSTPLTFITGLKYDTNVVKALNNLTFLYDPNWEYETGNATYPIAFFYVRKLTEDMSAEPSQKPLLFYNSENGKNKDSKSAGLINIVADNIIIKPKTYKLDLLIPMNMNNFFSNGYYNADTITSVNAFLLTSIKEVVSKVGESNIQDWNKQLSVVSNIGAKSLNILKTLLTALYGTELSASSIVTMLCQQQDYNKNSIEYMWRNRRILKMKMWTGWNFKYLAITNFEVTKTGENGSFFEGTLTCQEMPILTLKKSSSLSTTFMSSHVSAVLGEGMKVATEQFINLMEATAGGK